MFACWSFGCCCWSMTDRSCCCRCIALASWNRATETNEASCSRFAAFRLICAASMAAVAPSTSPSGGRSSFLAFAAAMQEDPAAVCHCGCSSSCSEEDCAAAFRFLICLGFTISRNACFTLARALASLTTSHAATNCRGAGGGCRVAVVTAWRNRALLFCCISCTSCNAKTFLSFAVRHDRYCSIASSMC